MTNIESMLNQDDIELKPAELAVQIMRELLFAIGKVTAYEADHPLAMEAVERPYRLFEKWFRFCSVAWLSRKGQRVYFGGLEMPRDSLTDQFSRKLDALKLDHVVWLAGMGPQDLMTMLGRITTLAPGSIGDRWVAIYLEDQHVTKIRVNDQKWKDSLSRARLMNGSEAEQLTVADLVMQECGKRVDLVAAAVSGHTPSAQVLIRRYGCYFTPEILSRVLPVSFARMPIDRLVQLVDEEISGDRPDLLSLIESSQRYDYLRRLISAFDSHPRRRDLLAAARRLFHRHGMSDAAYQVFDPEGAAQPNPAGEVDEHLLRMFSTACTPADLKNFGMSFVRVLRGGSQEKPKEILSTLLLHLKRDDRAARRRAHFALGRALAAANATTNGSVIGWFAMRLTEDICLGEDTFEFSDLLAGAGEQLVMGGRIDLLSEVAHSLRSGILKSESPADHLVAESVLRRWGQPRIVSELLRVATIEPKPRRGYAISALTAIGGPEIASRAAAMVTHSKRSTRMTMLKLLSALGPDAREVCVQLLTTSGLWERPQQESALPDTSWYSVRNALYILGRLGDPEALPVIVKHADDPDSRVRLEVVRALENVGSSDALSSLLAMTNDADADVREGAIVAMGAAGGPHEVFVLQELFGADVSRSEKIIHAIGHIGGPQAKTFLFELLERDERFGTSGLADHIGRLREAVLRALAQNPDSEIIERIEQYCQKHKRTFRIPVASDNLSDTAKIRLESARQRLSNS